MRRLYYKYFDLFLSGNFVLILVHNNPQLRLNAWDEVDEQATYKRQCEEERRKRFLENGNEPPKKKRGRLGPETWKLRGAARPAHEVYGKDCTAYQKYMFP